MKLNEDQGFVNDYYNGNLREIPEKKFTGILIENKVTPDSITIIQRYLPYNLDGKEVYVKNVDLSKYVGKRVVMTGKNYKFPLEGTQRDEIWPGKH